MEVGEGEWAGGERVTVDCGQRIEERESRIEEVHRASRRVLCIHHVLWSARTQEMKAYTVVCECKCRVEGPGRGRRRAKKISFIPQHKTKHQGTIKEKTRTH